MKCSVALVALVAGLSLPARADPQEATPPECQRNDQGVVNYEACAAATPSGSPPHRLALINLGTQAFLRQDYPSAVRYYDEAQPPNSDRLYSDVTYHAFRAAAFDHVDRHDEALQDAVIALRMLHRDSALPLSSDRYMPEGVDAEAVYELIVPPLQYGDQGQFHGALEELKALPASDWVSYSNRSAVFDQIHDLPNALEMNQRALALAPNEAEPLNNQCYILFELHRGQEALAYCQRAVAAAPQVAAIRHSYASVLAQLGRCAEAGRELANARRLDPSSIEYRQQLQCGPSQL
jgi:tetratricopeptide (TPR) repeat protein